jgi:hypothetical protein
VPTTWNSPSVPVDPPGPAVKRLSKAIARLSPLIARSAGWDINRAGVGQVGAERYRAVVGREDRTEPVVERSRRQTQRAAGKDLASIGQRASVRVSRRCRRRSGPH